jgi:hypothetical protein
MGGLLEFVDPSKYTYPSLSRFADFRDPGDAKAVRTGTSGDHELRFDETVLCLRPRKTINDEHVTAIFPWTCNKQPIVIVFGELHFEEWQATLVKFVVRPDVLWHWNLLPLLEHDAPGRAGGAAQPAESVWFVATLEDIDRDFLFLHVDVMWLLEGTLFPETFKNTLWLCEVYLVSLQISPVLVHQVVIIDVGDVMDAEANSHVTLLL